MRGTLLTSYATSSRVNKFQLSYFPLGILLVALFFSVFDSGSLLRFESSSFPLGLFGFPWGLCPSFALWCCVLLHLCLHSFSSSFSVKALYKIYHNSFRAVSMVVSGVGFGDGGVDGGGVSELQLHSSKDSVFFWPASIIWVLFSDVLDLFFFFSQSMLSWNH